MEPQRQKAYRYLLYQAMLDIRPVAWMPLGFLNPLNWKRITTQVRRAGFIADWLHNLALFSAIDFERFDETRFWDDFRRLQDRYPKFELSQYQEIFDREVAGTGQFGRKQEQGLQ